MNNQEVLPYFSQKYVNIQYIVELTIAGKIVSSQLVEALNREDAIDICKTTEYYEDVAKEYPGQEIGFIITET